MKMSNLLDERAQPLVDPVLAQPSIRAVTVPEKLITVKAAAEVVGLPVWKLRRAAKQGVFPTYTLLNTRRLVKLSEVIACIEASRQGGAE